MFHWLQSATAYISSAIADSLEFHTMIVPSLLRFRSARPLPASPNRFDSERESLHKLMRDNAKGLAETLQDTVNAASDLCETDCAGITRVERLPNGAESLRWLAANGPLSAVVDQPMCLDRNLKSILKEQKPRLVFRPHRLFAHIAESWNIAEALLVPWSGDRSRGILWVFKRFDAKTLDADDVRMLVNLATFASFAIAKDQVEASRLDEERTDAAARVAHELAHAVNNPLQALTNSLYLMNSAPSPHLRDAQTQLQRINALVRVILDENARPFKN
jgi:hypothetical protein